MKTGTLVRASRMAVAWLFLPTRHLLKSRGPPQNFPVRQSRDMSLLRSRRLRRCGRPLVIAIISSCTTHTSTNSMLAIVLELATTGPERGRERVTFPVAAERQMA